MGRGAPFTANLAFYFLADWAPGGQDNIGIFFSTHTHSFLPFRDSFRPTVEYERAIAGPYHRIK